MKIYGKVMPPVINQLFIYPIKSCAGVSVQDFQFDQKGPLLDRRWMLVDASTGNYLSQREIAKMALIATVIEDDAVYAQQSFNSALSKKLRLPVVGDLLDVQVWEDRVQGLDCGGEAAEWFSALLDLPCRLIYQGDCERLVDVKYAAEGTQVSFSDGFPLLVISQASLDFLNNACVGATITAENFRPNIVVANTDVFAEKRWLSLATDQGSALVNMAVVKPCQRCVIPLLNPKTAERESSILPVLLKYCRVDKKIIFGQNLTFNYSGNESLAVGQTLIINSQSK